MNALPPSRPLVVLDLDGVLTEHPRVLARAAAAHFGVDVPDDAFVDSAGLGVPEHVRSWAYGAGGPATRLAAAPDAARHVRRLLEHADARVVTARSAAMADETRAWLAEHDLPLEVLHADDKPAVARSLGAACAIEDSARHAAAYALAGVPCVLIGGAAEAERVHPVATLGEAVDAVIDLLPAPSTGPRPRLVISDVVDAEARALLEAGAELVDVDGRDPSALAAAVADADALLVRSETRVTEEVLAAAPRLRVVARAGVGVDTIDVEAATRRGVLVLNTPGANRLSAGEHTIALLLALARDVVPAHFGTVAGEWPRKRLHPIDLAGRTAGIVGLGRVGSVVATRLAAFEMHVIAHDPYVRPERFRELGVEPVSLDELVERSDVVTLHVPATAETRGLLDEARIRRLRRGAIVLNAARGPVADDAALARALADGHLRGVGVDVYPAEPATSSPLFGLDRVVCTPHTGGSSAEALRAVGQMIATTTLRALAGDAVPNAVNLPASTIAAAELRALTTAAGAAGRLLGALVAAPEHLRVTVNGLVPADVVEHATTACLAELLAASRPGAVSQVNARLVAGERGVAVRVHAGTDDPSVAPSFSFDADGDEHHHVRVSWDRHDAAIVEVDRYSLDAPLRGDILITMHEDRPGMIGRLGTLLGDAGVNIAGMQLGRHGRGGAALMVLNVDDAIAAETLDAIRAVDGVVRAHVVALPG